MIYHHQAANNKYYRLHLLWMRRSTPLPTLLFKHVRVTQPFQTN